MRFTDAPTRTGFRADHFAEGPDYRTIRRAGTDDYLLIVTRSGRGLHRAGGSVAVEANTALLYPPHAHQDYGTDESVGYWSFSWTHFVPPGTWDPLLSWPQRDGAGFLFLDEHAPQVFTAIDEVVRWRGVGRRPQFAWNALERALLWCNEANPLAHHRCGDPRVVKALSLIADRIGEPVRVSDIAEAVGLSRSRLSFVFRQEVGMTILDYLEQRRIEKAQDHLRMSDRPISEIATIVGYDDPLYFSKRFHHRTGMSPRQWRRHRGG